MVFRRPAAVLVPPEQSALTAEMIGIGMLFAGEGSPSPNIEETLLYASIQGMDGDDFRVLGVLCTWLDLHSARILADRLVQLASGCTSKRVRAFWAAFSHWKRRDRRFVKLQALHEGSRLDLFATGQEFQLRRFGEDPRFAGSPLRVDAKILRDRRADVMTPAELAKSHAVYRWRLIIGPTYRADLWAFFSAYPSASVSDAARMARSSIGAAWQTKHDFALLHPQPPPRTPMPRQRRGRRTSPTSGNR